MIDPEVYARAKKHYAKAPFRRFADGSGISGFNASTVFRLSNASHHFFTLFTEKFL